MWVKLPKEAERLPEAQFTVFGKLLTNLDIDATYLDISYTELGKRWGCKPDRIRKAIQGLEAKGWVGREQVASRSQVGRQIRLSFPHLKSLCETGRSQVGRKQVDTHIIDIDREEKQHMSEAELRTAAFSFFSKLTVREKVRCSAFVLARVLKDFNAGAGKSHEPTEPRRKQVAAILAQRYEGRQRYTPNDILSVVWSKTEGPENWLDNEKMARHLSLDTLLRPANFQKYLEQAREEGYIVQSEPKGGVQALQGAGDTQPTSRGIRSEIQQHSEGQGAANTRH